MEPLLDTKAASQFLLEKCGVHRSVRYLRKLRSVGGGPSFYYLNLRPYYTSSSLIEWVEGRLSAPQLSTSQPTTRPASCPTRPDALA
jgi:hypothetical protein